MKHGKGAKKKGTPKKVSGKSGGKARKAGPGKVAKKITAGRSAATAKGDGRAGRSAAVSFTNPLVGNAFRRAVKKYSTALKRLPD